jgi:hypothetical protein
MGLKSAFLGFLGAGSPSAAAPSYLLRGTTLPTSPHGFGSFPQVRGRTSHSEGTAAGIESKGSALT